MNQDTQYFASTPEYHLSRVEYLHTLAHPNSLRSVLTDWPTWPMIHTIPGPTLAGPTAPRRNALVAPAPCVSGTRNRPTCIPPSHLIALSDWSSSSDPHHV